MHTLWQRASALSTFAVTVLAIMASLASVTDLFHPSKATVDLDVKGVDALYAEKGVDKALLNIEMHADLRSEFSWNTKQLYVYVLAEFATEESPYNEMVIWNRIIQSKANAKLDIRKLQKMYPFVLSDQGKSLRDTEFNVTVAWNVMPHVGRLYTRKKTFTGLAFPSYYIEPKKNTKSS
eukprot:jgi/Picre1/30314/NNA_005678.t1